MELRGTVSLVTGGNGGIGLGFARGVARMGGDIAIWARNEEKSAAARTELLAAGAHRVEFVEGLAGLAQQQELLALFGHLPQCVIDSTQLLLETRGLFLGLPDLRV